MLKHIQSLVSSVITIAVLVSAVFALIPAGIAAAAPICPLSSQGGRTIVNFDGSQLVSDTPGVHETSATLTLPVFAGTYDITLVSYDNHAAETVTQEAEQWFVWMKNASGNIIGTSEAIADLPDGQNWLTQTVNLNYRVSVPISAVVAHHAAVFARGQNSIIPVCVAFDLKDGLPQVTSDVANFITNDEATLHGAVNPNGTSDVMGWFEWGTSSTLGLKTSEMRIVSTQSISARISGLLKNTQYYFRTAARNASGTSYGPILTFTTAGADLYAPFVSTDPITNIGDTSATFNGYVNPNGSSDTVRWFEWGYSSSLGNKTPDVSVGSAAAPIMENMTGLARGSSYYVRAFARNQRGTSQGDLVSFQTYPISPVPTGNPSPTPASSPTPVSSPLPSAPVVSTQVPTFVVQNTAVLNGHVSASPSVATYVWFEWGTQASLGSSTARRNVGYVSSADFADSLIRLSPNTFYYFRAVAENAYGKSYGATFLFRTLAIEDQTAGSGSGSGIGSSNGGASGSGSGGSSVSDISSARAHTGLLNIAITPSDKMLPIGHTIPFVVTFENFAKRSLENAVLTVTLPPDLGYQKISDVSGVMRKNATLDGDVQVITFPVGSIAAGDKGSATIDALLKVGTIDKKIFTTKAEITYIDSASQAGGKETTFAINTADAGASFAALLFAGGLWAWLLWGLLGLLLLLLILYLLGRRKDAEDEQKK